MIYIKTNEGKCVLRPLLADHLLLVAPPGGLEPADSHANTIQNSSLPTNTTKQCSHNNHLSDILTFGLWMRKQGFRESTCRGAVSALKTVNVRTNIMNTEDVKAYLANAKFSEAMKQRISYDLVRFYKWKAGADPARMRTPRFIQLSRGVSHDA